ncbi:hypothetical protein Goshw_028407, partial [Gossypium schwendimanii]|nr:hypothetical protein [Gossypium schwendimanii]
QETPLYIAARRRGSGRLLTLLLDQLKSTAHCGPHGRTALHAAAMAGDAEAIRIILAENGNLTTERDEDGYTPLHYAAHKGCNSVVEELLKRDVSAAYVGDKKRGMTPLLMAARQGYVGTVSKILSLYPDCCEKVDNEGLNLLHYLAFRVLPVPLSRPLFKCGGVKIAYGSVRNLMELEGVFGMTPQEVYNALRSENHFGKHHHKQKKIKELLDEIENDQVADEPVRHFRLRNVSTESLEKTRNAHLVVAAFIATVTFAATITVPGGLNSEKGLEEGTPLLIDDVDFIAFVVTNAIAFILSVYVLIANLGVLDNLFSVVWRETVLYQTRCISGILCCATIAMVLAFSLGTSM